MTKYVVKRVLLAILTVFIVCAITFFAMNAIPGGPFDGEKAISDEVRRVLEQRFNLDKPVWEQFFLYLNNLLHGDFGVSAKTGRLVLVKLVHYFGNVFLCQVLLSYGIEEIDYRRSAGKHRGSDQKQAAGQTDHLFLHTVYFSSQLCTGYPAFAGVLCEAAVGSGMESSEPQLRSSCNRAGSLSHGIHHPSDQDQYAGCSGTGLCAYSKGQRCFFF